MPEDLSGIPRQVDFYIRFLPLDLAMLLSKCAGILVLDEFLNERRDNMLASAFKLTRDYKIGDLALSKDALVVAASNGAEHSSLSNNICKPLRDRFAFIRVDRPSLEAWTVWMDQTYGVAGWNRTCLAYLRWKESDFLTNIEDTGLDDGLEPPATPRGWTAVATYTMKSLTAGLNEDDVAEFIRGKLGSVGERYWGFMQNRIPSFEELAKRPSVIKGYNIEQKYLVAVTIADAINLRKERIKTAVPIIHFIAENDDREIINATFAMLEAQRKLEVFAEVREDPVIFRAMEATGKALL